MSDVRIRPMTVDDAPAAERVTAVGFHELDIRMFRRSWPDPQLRPPERGAIWTDRVRHLVGTDPGGCWVAERDDELLGIVVSFVREKMWLLASYAVVPGAQGLGLGKALLAPALEHGRGCLRGMFNASSDPKALRRYHAAGFTMHPQMFLRGTPDRGQLPALEHLREGTESDIDLMDSVDRRTRGAAHGVDHQLLIRQFRLVVSETSTAQGYAYLDDGVVLLAATDRRTADTPDVGVDRLERRRPDRPHHPGERLGGRRRDGGAARAAPGGVPRAAAHEAAEAVPRPRRPHVISLR